MSELGQELQDKNISCVNCKEGHRMGCHSFCCRLLVRLLPEEMEETSDGSTPKGFVDKNPNGLCIHSDKESGLCKIWDKRPHTCRVYECNSDFLLQVVLREGFVNIAQTAKSASEAYIPLENYIKIPLLKE